MRNRSSTCWNQCFSTEVPQNPEVLRVAARGQGFCCNTLKLPGKNVFITESKIDTLIIEQGSINNTEHLQRFRCSKNVEKHWFTLNLKHS